jgi:DNA-binding transcriptional MerR regulator
LDQRYYPISQFARKASVSVRTLQYYDKEGLLPPSKYTESGYRLYTDEDLANLQNILALKFLGFSLEEIRVLLQTGPRGLQEVLVQQKAMMKEKRAQIDAIIRAIEETEKLLQAGQCDWESIIRVIRVIQMEQKKDWVNKYFTPEQRKKMEELSRKSYSEEAQRKMAEWGEWTEEDQKRVDQQYAYIGKELKRLVAEGANPANPEAQAIAKLQCGLIFQFTKGDPDIEAGLKTWWQNYNSLPDEEKPPIAPWSEEESAFLNKAVQIYKSKSQQKK